jgi:hypothetical protein
MPRQAAADDHGEKRDGPCPFLPSVWLIPGMVNMPRVNRNSGEIARAGYVFLSLDQSRGSFLMLSSSR